MTAPHPFPIGGGTVVLDHTFPAAQDLESEGWVLSGDGPAPLNWWQSPFSRPFISGGVLFQWTPNEPPFFRSTFWTKTFTAVAAPDQRLFITVTANWQLGTGFDSGAWVGMEANGVRGNVSHPIWGGPPRTFVIDTRADENGDLEVKIGVDRMNPSLNVNHSWYSFSVATGGFDPDPFRDIIINSAVLFEQNIPISLTRGGAAFEPNAVWEDYEFPGKTAPVVGLDEKVSERPVIRATAMLTGERPIEQYDPGGVWAAHAIETGARTYTPVAFRAALSAAVYLQDVLCIWKRLRGDYIAVEFPFALCRRYGIHGRDKDEGEIGIEIEARQGLVTEASEGPVVGDPTTTRLYLVHIFPSTFTLTP